MYGFARRRIELAMPDASPCAHSLKLAGPKHLAIAETVPMLQSTLEHVRNDFHIAMRMHAEALARRDPVLVHHPQGPEAHVLRVVVVRERKRVAGLQPAMVETAPIGRF